MSVSVCFCACVKAEYNCLLNVIVTVHHEPSVIVDRGPSIMVDRGQSVTVDHGPTVTVDRGGVDRVSQ